MLLTTPDFDSTRVFTRRYLLCFAALLWAVLAALNADAGFGGNRVANAVLWALQVPLGLGLLAVFWRMLNAAPTTRDWPALGLVAASAALASAAAAPLFWGAELVLAKLTAWPTDDAWPDTWRAAMASLAEEWLHMLLPFVAIWALLALPVLHRLTPIRFTRNPSALPGAADAASASVEPAGAQQAAIEPKVQSTANTTGDGPFALPQSVRGPWLAARSELQYVRVFTPRGSALVLGSLQEVETHFGDRGLRTHRSWWVACAAVARPNQAGRETELTLSNGLSVPISRRRRDAVLAALVQSPASLQNR
jgi:hypothetical protein